MSASLLLFVFTLFLSLSLRLTLSHPLFFCFCFFFFLFPPKSRLEYPSPFIFIVRSLYFLRSLDDHDDHGPFGIHRSLYPSYSLRLNNCNANACIGSFIKDTLDASSCICWMSVQFLGMVEHSRASLFRMIGRREMGKSWLDEEKRGLTILWVIRVPRCSSG